MRLKGIVWIAVMVLVGLPSRASGQITLADLLGKVREGTGAPATADSALVLEGRDAGSGAALRWTLDGRGRIRWEDGQGATVFDGTDVWRIDRDASPVKLSGSDREWFLLLGWVVGGHWVADGSPVSPTPQTLMVHSTLPMVVRVPGADQDAIVELGLSDFLPVAVGLGAGGLRLELSDRATLAGASIPTTIVVGPEDGPGLTYAFDQVRRVASEDGWFTASSPDGMERTATWGPVEVPIESAPTGHPLIAVRLGSSVEALWFVFDTGAATSTIAAWAADAASLARVRESRIGGMGGDGPRRTWVRAGTHMDIGGARFNIPEWKEATAQLELLSTPGRRVAGVVGWDVLKSAAVTLDGPASLMTVGPPGSLEPTGTQWHDLFVQWRVPYLEARIEGDPSIEGRFMLDTGAGRLGALVFNRTVVSSGYGAGREVDTRGAGMSGAAPMALDTADAVLLGNRRVVRPVIAFSVQPDGEGDPYAVGLLGMGVLGELRLTYDYANGRVGIAG